MVDEPNDYAREAAMWVAGVSPHQHVGTRPPTRDERALKERQASGDYCAACTGGLSKPCCTAGAGCVALSNPAPSKCPHCNLAVCVDWDENGCANYAGFDRHGETD